MDTSNQRRHPLQRGPASATPSCQPAGRLATRELPSAHPSKENAAELLHIVERDPFQTPPRYKKPVGDLAGAHSRRINIQHRLVYQALEREHVVKVLRLWTHYE